ncbi:hypothetical protein [Streptosporangium lutulentum]|uniref:Galactose oxidase, central domain n=1 Tax=Streptosporangium lutulentum TaxID=1461250 RepID=A0ABT9QK57_9ACTN|nr:hypothetical protein [Streptosporangium lutulentum]MDP9847140.1 hypothetical protein [Streptosporangium lutulentum]
MKRVLILALLVAGCGADPSPVRPTAAPPPPATATADPLETTDSCPSPPRGVNQFSPREAASGWELAWSAPGGGLNAGTAADGSLWAMHIPPAEDSKIILMRWDGRTWSELPVMPGDSALWPYSVADTRHVWVFAQPARFWDGTAWRQRPAPLDEADGSVHAARGRWAVNHTASAHWNGTAWQLAPVPIEGGGRMGGTDQAPWLLGGFSARGENEPVAELARWTGTAWQRVRLPAMPLPRDAKPVHSDTGRLLLGGVAPTGDGEFWVLGDYRWDEYPPDGDEPVSRPRPVALRHADGRWTCTWGPASRENQGFSDAEPDGSGGLWTILRTQPVFDGRGEVWHLAEGRWTREFLPVADGLPYEINDLAVIGTTVYALGVIRDPRGTQFSALWRLNR